MLDIATGQQLLQARRLAAGRAAELLARAAGLPGTLASVARRFLESQTARRLPDGHEEVGPELDGLDDHRLETVFEVLLPGLGTAAVQTWRSIGRGFAGSFGMPMPCRVTDEPAVNLGKQMDWLRTTQRVVLDFPPEITTPEGLAVWAPFLEDPFRQQFLGMLFGTSIEGVGTAAHVGRLLASVIDQGGSAGHNVLDTLRLTVHDRHPATTFAGHVPRAFWRSGNAEAHDLLLDHLVTDRRSDRRRFIVRAAGETSLRHMESLLRRLLAHPDALDVGVFAEIRGWLGLPEGNAPAALMEEFVAQLVDAIAARSLGLPLPEVPSARLLHACSTPGPPWPKTSAKRCPSSPRSWRPGNPRPGSARSCSRFGATIPPPGRSWPTHSPIRICSSPTWPPASCRGRTSRPPAKAGGNGCGGSSTSAGAASRQAMRSARGSATSPRGSSNASPRAWSRSGPTSRSPTSAACHSAASSGPADSCPPTTAPRTTAPSIC
jgi:hypothetical protein